MVINMVLIKVLCNVGIKTFMLYIILQLLCVHKYSNIINFFCNFMYYRKKYSGKYFIYFPSLPELFKTRKC